MKKLLIFDMNGVLCRRRKLDQCKEIFFDFLKTEKLIIIIRPGIIDFLDQLSKHYKIALWTCGSMRDMFPFVEYIEKNISFDLKFVCYGDKCARTNNKKVKKISLLTDYDENNVIIIDDTFMKVSSNKNYIIPKTFNPNIKDEQYQIDELNKLYLKIINKNRHKKNCVIL